MKRLVLLPLLLLGFACSDSEPEVGTERGACYPNMTCNAGLTCSSDRCVREGGNDAGTNDAGTTGPVAGPFGDFQWDFETGTTQGWTFVSNDIASGMSVNNVISDNFSGVQGNGYGLEPSDFMSRDDNHSLILIRSPQFYLDASRSILARTTGGVGDGSRPTSADDLAPNTQAQGNRPLGIAVRLESTGEYIAFAQRRSDGDWEDIVINPSSTLAAADKEIVTLDIIDAYGGFPWSWLVVDAVQASGWVATDLCPEAPCAMDVRCTTEMGQFPGFSCGDCPPPLVGDGLVCNTALAAVGEDCENTACDTGLLCVTLDAGPRCMETCTNNSDCTDSFRNECVGLGTDLNVCFRYAAKDETCGNRGPEQSRCREGQTPALYCDSSLLTCQESELVTTPGAACTVSGDTTEPPRQCDPSAQLGCDATSATCVPQVLAAEGEACTGGRAEGGVITGCGNDLSCGIFGNGIFSCIRPCEIDVPGQCTVPGTTCIQVLSGSRGACFDTDCQQDADCVYPGYRCTQGPDGPLCMPRAPSGPVAFGDICTDTNRCNVDPNAGGDPAASCLRTNAGSDGYCTRNCAADGLCPTYDAGANGSFPAMCVPLGGASGCVFPCNQGQGCPPHLACTEIGGTSLCVAP